MGRALLAAVASDVHGHGDTYVGDAKAGQADVSAALFRTLSAPLQQRPKRGQITSNGFLSTPAAASFLGAPSTMPRFNQVAEEVRSHALAFLEDSASLQFQRKKLPLGPGMPRRRPLGLASFTTEESDERQVSGTTAENANEIDKKQSPANADAEVESLKKQQQVLTPQPHGAIKMEVNMDLKGDDHNSVAASGSSGKTSNVGVATENKNAEQIVATKQKGNIAKDNAVNNQAQVAEDNAVNNQAQEEGENHARLLEEAQKNQAQLRNDSNQSPVLANQHQPDVDAHHLQDLKEPVQNSSVLRDHEDHEVLDAVSQQKGLPDAHEETQHALVTNNANKVVHAHAAQGQTQDALGSGNAKKDKTHPVTGNAHAQVKTAVDINQNVATNNGNVEDGTGESTCCKCNAQNNDGKEIMWSSRNCENLCEMGTKEKKKAPDQCQTSKTKGVDHLDKTQCEEECKELFR